MDALFKQPLLFNNFSRTREWRNGRRAGLRIRCRKAWGFKSPLSQCANSSMIYWDISKHSVGRFASYRPFDSQVDSHRVKIRLISPSRDR